MVTPFGHLVQLPALPRSAFHSPRGQGATWPGAFKKKPAGTTAARQGKQGVGFMVSTGGCGRARPSTSQHVACMSGRGAGAILGIPHAVTGQTRTTRFGVPLRSLAGCDKACGAGNEWMRCLYGLRRQPRCKKPRGIPVTKGCSRRATRGLSWSQLQRGLMATNTLACGTRHARSLLLQTGRECVRRARLCPH